MRTLSPLAFVILCGVTIIFFLWISQNLTSNTKPHYYVHFDTPQSTPWANSTDRFIPLEYALDRKTHYKQYSSNSCALFPPLVNIHYASPYWQSLKVNNASLNLYGAYWDDRKNNTIRILVVYDTLKWPKLYCHLWYQNKGDPVTVPVSEIVYGWREAWGGPYDKINEPYILSCPVAGNEVPSAVSLVVRPCDQVITALKVQNEVPSYNKPKKEFAVCVKWMLYPQDDVSFKLVEWLELVKLFGAAKVFVHLLQAHPNVLKVLSTYMQEGFVDVTEYGFPPPKSYKRILQNRYIRESYPLKEELLPYNDCLYRNLRNYRFLGVFDMDEIIVPMMNSKWTYLMKRIFSKEKIKYDAYYVKNIYFLETLQDKMTEKNDVPRYSYMMKHVWRTRNYSKPGYFVKSFHETSRVLALHNHLPMKCLYGKNYTCNCFQIDTKYARLQHYRKDCLGHLQKEECDRSCKNPVRDLFLWRWKEILLHKVKRRLINLNMIDVVY